MKKYRVAVIGRTGRGNYGHGLDVVWKGMENVEIVAVADPDPTGRAKAAKDLGAKNAYADYRTMLDKEKPQIVSVAERFLDEHKEKVIACARAGASMFLEKPMARTLAEADEMVTACEMHHVKLAIAHQTRYSPRIAQVKELIGSGALGDVLEVRMRGKEDRRGGGEDMMVLGTHLFDLARFLVGDPSWCFARVLLAGKPVTRAEVRQGGENMGPIAGDQITASYGLPGGVLATFGTTRAKHGVGARFALSLFGTRGVVQMGTGSLPPVWFCEDPSWMPGRSKAKWVEVTSAGPGKPETMKGSSLVAGNVLIVKDLIQAIEKDTQPKGSLYDGRWALEMIMAVYESHRLAAPVNWPIKNRQHPLSML